MRSFILILLGAVPVVAIPTPQLHAALMNSLSGNLRPVWPQEQLGAGDDSGDMLDDDSADEQSGIEKRFAAQVQVSSTANIPHTQSPASLIPSGTTSYIAATPSSTTAVAEKAETPNSRDAISRVPLAIQQIPTDGYSNSTSGNLNTTDGTIIDHTAPPWPPAPRKSLIPHWSDRKSSIAAATVFSVVTAAAFTFIIVIFIRRLRGSWKRHKRAREEDEKQEQQTMTDVRVPSSDDYLASDAAMYEEKEERVWWLFNNRSRSPEQQNSPGDGTQQPQMSSTTNLSVAFGWKNQDPGSRNSPSPQGNASSVDLATLDRQYDLNLSTSQRRGSLGRNPVVVPSPVTPITSCAARESSVADEQVTQDTPQPQAVSRPQQSHVVDGKGSLGTASTQSAGSNRLGLLPSIQRTDSPFLRFSEG